MNLRENLFYIVVYGPGFGESIVLREPGGAWVVIDGCLANGKSPPATLLRDEGAAWSCAVLTHPHLDHALGLDAVLAGPGGGPIGCAAPQLADPKTWSRSPDAESHLKHGTVEHVLAAVHDRWEADPSCRWEMRRGDARRVGGIDLTVLHPPQSVVDEAPPDPNRLSTGVIATWKGVTLLLGSDVIAVDWEDIKSRFPSLATHSGMKFPHHGSEGAVHASWGDGDAARLWVMSPYSRGRKLPRFEDGHGVDWALQRVERVHLTGLPIKHALQGRTPYETTRHALRDGLDPPAEAREVGGLRFSLKADPAGVADVCFVAAGFDEGGNLVDLQHGPGAVVVRDGTTAA